VESALTKDDPRDKDSPGCFCKIYTYTMAAGKTYQIDLMSKEFDAFLRLENSAGKTVADDDDGGGNLNARIVYKADASGDYKIIASTFADGKTGKFTLTVNGGDKVVAQAPKKTEVEKKPELKPIQSEKKPEVAKKPETKTPEVEKKAEAKKANVEKK